MVGYEPNIYDQVEAILGKEDADLHLSLVLLNQTINPDKCMTTAFIWADSPQGHHFWKSVYGALPRRNW